ADNEDHGFPLLSVFWFPSGMSRQRTGAHGYSEPDRTYRSRTRGSSFALSRTRMRPLAASRMPNVRKRRTTRASCRYRLTVDLCRKVHQTDGEVPVLVVASHFFELEEVLFKLGLQAGQIRAAFLRFPDPAGSLQDVSHDLPHEGQGALRFTLCKKPFELHRPANSLPTWTGPSSAAPCLAAAATATFIPKGVPCSRRGTQFSSRAAPRASGSSAAAGRRLSTRHGRNCRSSSFFVRPVPHGG